MTRNRSLLRWAAAFLFVGLVALWLLFVSGCASVGTPRIDPPVHFADTSMIAWYSAEQDANAQGGDVYYVQDTRSMEPLLFGGDYIVVVGGYFNKRVVGEVWTYNADWQPETEPYVTHRAVEKDGDGFLMSGDNSPYSESRWRVTARNYVGLVTSIWRVRA